jgi:hypothetical protein
MLPTTNNFFSTVSPSASAAWPSAGKEYRTDFNVATEGG